MSIRFPMHLEVPHTTAAQRIRRRRVQQLAQTVTYLAIVALTLTALRLAIILVWGCFPATTPLPAPAF